MEIMGFIFGMSGVSMGVFGLIAYNRIVTLEKKLKEIGVLDKDYTSE